MKEMIIGFFIGILTGAMLIILLRIFCRKNKKTRFKINGDTMTSIVIYSLLFCGSVTIAGMTLGAFDHDVSAIVPYSSRTLS